MRNGSKHLFTFLIATLFLVATNHCAFESLFSDHSATETACTSHPKDDPDSHSEGNPCATKFLSAQSQTELVPEALVLSASFVNKFFSLLEFPESDFLLSHPQISNEFARIELSPLISLSIASNAPPVTA